MEKSMEKPMIDVQQVSGGYDEEPVIQQVSFTVDEGEFLVLLGPNGSGKSTLLNMLTGQLPVQQGKVYIDGQDIRSMSTLEKARHMTVLAQEEQITFDFTVEEIVQLGRYPHQRGIFKLLTVDDQQVVEEAMDLTQVNDYRYTPFRRLSGGEKQRVLLAKALAQEPKILLLDEPTNHLDLHHTFHLLTLLKQWQTSKQLTVFAILHDVNVAALYADRIALLKEGKVADIGEVELLKKEKKLEDVYQVQVTAGNHPHTPKPQLFLTPEMETIGLEEPYHFANQYTLHEHEDGFLLHFSRPLKTISNAVWGGGLRWVSYFYSFYVPHNYAGSHHQEHISTWLKNNGVPAEQAVGLTTTVHLQDTVCLQQEKADVSLLIFTVATTDTMQTMLFIDGDLTEGALIEASQMVTEGKMQAVHELGPMATRSAFDRFVVAATQRGSRFEEASAHTSLGQDIRHNVYQGITQAVQQKMCAKKILPEQVQEV